MRRSELQEIQYRASTKADPLAHWDVRLMQQDRAALLKYIEHLLQQLREEKRNE